MYIINRVGLFDCLELLLVPSQSAIVVYCPQTNAVVSNK